MIMTNSSIAGTAGRSGLVGTIDRLYGWLERLPYAALAVPLRLAVAIVFWNSARSHLANWDTTLALFEDEYKVPLLPPDFAAQLTVAIEVSAPVLMVLGLATRPTALVLLGMTTVIEVFVYPQAWPTHIQWAAMMLVLLCRGPGRLSVDELIRLWAHRSRSGLRKGS